MARRLRSCPTQGYPRDLRERQIAWPVEEGGRERERERDIYIYIYTHTHVSNPYLHIYIYICVEFTV